MKATTTLPLFLLLLTFVLLGCNLTPQEGITVPVEWKGALKNMMRRGDISAQADLKDLENTSNLYALGAVSELQGEILILNGLPLISSVQDEQLRVDTSFDYQATLLVYASVEDWVSDLVPTTVKTKAELEAYLASAATAHGLHTDAPFPFRLQATVERADWHVIDWPAGDTEHTHEKHIQSGLSGAIKQQEVEILGFYSEHHHAVFTHHTTNMHLHLRTIDNTIVGHVDDLVLREGAQLLLPRVVMKVDTTAVD